MNNRISFGKGALVAAAAAMTLATAISIPTLAAAQPYDSGTYYDPCQRDKNDRAVTGALLGAAAGAAIGNGLAQHGGKPGGTVLGGLAGAAVGANVGAGTAACESGYYPAPPPPPPGYYDERPTYYEPPRPQCGSAENRIYYPDGSSESYPVRACQDTYGRWHVTR